MTQYDDISDKYVRVKNIDPAKQYVQYPGAMKLLGVVKEKRILDVGCGDGEFSRRLARRGALVTGYDISEVQLQKAREQEQKEKLGISYVLAAPEKFTGKGEFDKSVSIMVLPYAKDKKELCFLFSATYRVLKQKGLFVSIMFNPSFTRFGKIAYYRRWTKLNHEKIKVEFFERGVVPFFSATISDFSLKDYERAAADAGFTQSLWHAMKVSAQGIAREGALFWKGFEKDCPYIAFVVKK